jgi:hypothetical protein
MSTKKSRKKRPVNAPAPSKTAARVPNQGKASATKAQRPHAKRPLSPLEVQLRRALAEMGLARARRVFAAVEASFDD